MITQRNSKQYVDYKHSYRLAFDVASEIAHHIHAINNNSHGVLNDGLYGPSGLRNLANRYLRSLPNNGYNGAILVEQELDNNMSHYYPSWVKVHISSLYDTSIPTVRDISIEACCARG